MRPGATILQLDTHFPRIKGDIGCAETFAEPVEILRIADATVRTIVRCDPMDIDIAPFEAAIKYAKGAVITTSCGFLAPWQSHLSKVDGRPVLASALTVLTDLRRRFAADEISILTFDAAKLTPAHLGAHGDLIGRVIGLLPQMHVRQVIEQDRPTLDPARAQAELLGLLTAALPKTCKALVLECTNLPPYRRAMARAFGVQVFDSLSCLETLRPGLIRPGLL